MITDKYSKDIGFIFGIPLLIGASYYLSKKYLKGSATQINSNTKEEKYGCIELGGTSIRLAIGKKMTDSHGKVSCSIVEGSLVSIQTSDPETNINQIRDYFAVQTVEKVGIASFGPICLDQTSEQFGYITTTPKIAWKNFPLLKQISHAIPLRTTKHIGIDTDVNAAALAEFSFGLAQQIQLGNHKAKESLAYITVGTGVGVGLIVGAKCVHGLTHPEGGHILVRPYPGDTYKGICKKHQTCVEGLVSNYAIAERLGIEVSTLVSLDDKDNVWEIVANYLAQLCLNLTLLSSPEVIVIGGGILTRKNIIIQIRQHFLQLLNGYIEHPRLTTSDGLCQIFDLNFIKILKRTIGGQCYGWSNEMDFINKLEMRETSLNTSTLT